MATSYTVDYLSEKRAQQLSNLAQSVQTPQPTLLLENMGDNMLKVINEQLDQAAKAGLVGLSVEVYDVVTVQEARIVDAVLGQLTNVYPPINATKNLLTIYLSRGALTARRGNPVVSTTRVLRVGISDPADGSED